MKMKQCPTCTMIVEAENECPYCQTTLTYEATIESEAEHIVYNKYFWIWMLKRVWFSIACSIICIIRVITQHPTTTPLVISMFGLCTVSLVVSFFQRGLEKLASWKYSNEYSKFKMLMWKYVLGGTAVLFSLFL